MKLPKSFHPYALTTILLWALAYVLTRLVLQHFSVYALGFLRYLAASAALLVVCLVTKMPPPKLRDLPWFVVSGGAGFFLYSLAFNIGTGQVTAATSSVVIATVPVFTALLAGFVFRERLSRAQWLAIAVQFAGILILTLYGAVFSANTGAVWLLLAALLLSCYNLLQRRLTRTYTALQSTTYSIFIGTILLAIFLPRSVGELSAAPLRPIVYIGILGVFSGALAYIAWAKALELAEKTSLVSNYMFFTPFITALLGFVIAGEVPEASTWAGGVCIIVGAVLFNRKQPAASNRRA